jgi:hypothetical protein
LTGKNANNEASRNAVFPLVKIIARELP